MFSCPNCDLELVRQTSTEGIFWGCSRCDGRSIGIGLLRRSVSRDYVNTLWNDAMGESGRACPVCTQSMLRASVGSGAGSVDLDVCKRCRLVWFDGGELDRAPGGASAVVRRPDLADEELEPLARLQAAQIARRWAREPDAELVPPGSLEMVPALLGMPVQEETPLTRWPLVTWFVAAAVLVISSWSLLDADLLVRFGFLASDPGRYGGATLLTYFFVHGGLFHAISSVYFLSVFGDDVEELIGSGGLTALLVLSALSGAALHGVFHAGSSAPLAGASAGVSGVVLFFGLKFPHAQLRYFRLYRWYSMPASVATTVWFVAQLVGSREQLGSTTDVSVLAHLGGCLVGFGFWLMWRKDKPRVSFTPARSGS